MSVLPDLHNSLERPFCDAVINVDGVQFKVHKFILCGCSKVFEALFLRHSKPDRKEFKVPGVSVGALQLIIEFAYTGSVSVTEDNVEELFQAANQFGIPGIEQACCHFLLERLSPENCIGFWQFSNICFYPELLEEAFRYLLHHFEEVVSTEEFQQLSVQELSAIFDSDELNTRWESTLWDAIQKWVYYDPEGREQHLAVLLTKVRLALTNQIFLTHLMHTHPVRGNAECMDIVQQAMNLKACMSMLRPSLCLCSNAAVRPRLPNAIIFAIGGLTISGLTNITEVYNFHTDHWNTVSYSGAPHHARHGTVHCNGSIYCVGGMNNSCYMSTVHRLDLTTHTWHEVAPMHEHRKDASVTVLGGLIYAIGGCSDINQLKSAERYDPETNQWSLIASMNEPRDCASCTSLHNKIYICGGDGWVPHLNTCEYYNPQTNQWTIFASMRHRRAGLGVIAYGGLIFAVGGAGHINNKSMKSVEAYNPRTKTWNRVSPMLTARSHFGIAVIDDKLFVAGGDHGIEDNGDVEYYDLSTRRWSRACQMGVPRSKLSCCVVSGLPNIAEHLFGRDKMPRPDEEEGLVEPRHSIGLS